MKIVVICIILSVTGGYLQAQERNRMNISTRMDQEKKQVLEKVPELTADQKLILDDIYSRFIADFDSIRAESAGNREEMRSRMREVHKEKTEALKDLLTEEQFTTIQPLIRPRQGRPGNTPPNQ